jgi:PleD family two-component response regulator
MGIASTETSGYALDVQLHEADMAVYAAKREGRNRTSLANPARVPKLYRL